MLRRKLADELLPATRRARLAVTFSSSATSTARRATPTSLFDVRFLPNPHYEAEAAPADRPRRRGRRLHRPRRRARGVLRPRLPAARLPAPAVRGARARRTCWWRSAAPAAVTARSRSPSTWRAATASRATTWSTSLTATSASRPAADPSYVRLGAENARRDRSREPRGERSRAVRALLRRGVLRRSARAGCPAEPGAVAWGVDGPVWSTHRWPERRRARATWRCAPPDRPRSTPRRRPVVGAGGRDDGAAGVASRATGRGTTRACLRDPDGAAGGGLLSR